MTMREEIEAAAARYPDRRSAIMPALMIAQKEHGHLPGPVLEEVAQILGVERVWVYELATFYTLFHTEPIGSSTCNSATTSPACCADPRRC